MGQGQVDVYVFVFVVVEQFVWQYGGMGVEIMVVVVYFVDQVVVFDVQVQVYVWLVGFFVGIGGIVEQDYQQMVYVWVEWQLQWCIVVVMQVDGWLYQVLLFQNLLGVGVVVIWCIG